VSDIEHSVGKRGADRPWLTAACDRLLGHITTIGSSGAAAPLSQVPRRLLVVKVHGMGDSVLVRAILQQLQSRFPDMDIGVLVGAGTAEIMTLDSNFRPHMYSQKQLSLRSALRTLFEIRRSHYDTVLNFEQGSVAGTAFLAATGIPIRLGFVTPGQDAKARFLSHCLQFDEDRSMWQSFVALARLLDPGLAATMGAFPIRSRPEPDKWLEEWWRAHIGGCQRAVAIHLGSARGMDFRRWPLERFVRLAEELEFRFGKVSIVLTGAEAERDLIQRFMHEYSGHAVDASDLGTIERTIGLLRRCGLLVSNDTGIMHLGAAMGVPTVGLFGPNTPRHWAPIGPRATYVYDTAAPCSPCINNYTNRMPSVCMNTDKSRCMHDISVASVLAAVTRVVAPAWMA
jgi:ADP-heptose:LPS heptosyltransferase